MANPDSEREAVRVRVSSRSSLVENMQEITLRTALNQAIGQVADCFDDCNRQAELGSVFSMQSEASEKTFFAVDGYQFTLTYTSNLVSSLIHNGLDYLVGATDAALGIGPGARWSALSLTRSLIEASVECFWLADPALDLETRLRRTNQMFVKSCHDMLRILPDDNETNHRLLSVDPKARAVCLEGRDAALKWAVAQGWSCDNGKPITLNRWIGAVPAYREAVVLMAQAAPLLASVGGPDYWKDMYSMLSGATHSQPGLVALSLRDEPDAFLDRALMILGLGLTFYTEALKRYADFMGWHDSEIDNWFGPVHATLEHIRFPEKTPLPAGRVNPEQCEICPDYQEPGMHRLALASHLCSLLERNISVGTDGDGEAPVRYSAAIEFFNRLQQRVMNDNDVDSHAEELRAAFGVGHVGLLSLFGADPSEVLTSVAASWAVLRSPSYQSSIGEIQGWLSRSAEGDSPTPYGNK